ncbi:hypothetical protein AB0D67_16250 [Streptosporangium sp. NPDC048047]|uniref:hypothetical protein n=1 Tax=Streptosporangium sp. NPDC048047 TaxID=3155748 RepID=UPI0034236CB9
MGRRRTTVAVAAAGLVSAAVAAVLFLPGEQGSQAARTAVRTPAPGDPLTGQEVALASAVASAGSRAHMAAGRVDLLYVERDDDKDAEERRQADAYLYDYGSDRLIVRKVDIGLRKVVEETVKQGVQPPPSKVEESRAIGLLLDDPRYGPVVRRSFAQAGGRELRSPSDLGVRGLIFTPAQEEAGGAAQCDTHRCVRLFVRLPDGTWLDTSRIVVDLSAKKIHTLEW